MTTEHKALDKLREPFPASAISKLPRITCGKCRNSQSKECNEHRKTRCRECSGWITPAHMHLDYVGHAALTQRLLDADPLWTWEPFALDEHGLPAFDRHGGLWIRLTVAGLQRLGYGDAGEKTGPNAVKEAIGDALRNAGMRFGAALDLWHKGDLPATQAEEPAPAATAPVNESPGVDLQAAAKWIDGFTAEVKAADSVKVLNEDLWPQLKAAQDSGFLNSRQVKDLINTMGGRKQHLEAVESAEEEAS